MANRASNSVSRMTGERRARLSSGCPPAAEGDAAAGALASNHSYGQVRGWRYSSGNDNWYWYGDITINTMEDYLFGFYDSRSRDWDEIAHNAPYYLICISAGNDRNDEHTGGHYVWSDGDWVWSTDPRDPDGGQSGYDCLPQRKTDVVAPANREKGRGGGDFLRPRSRAAPGLVDDTGSSP